MVWFSELGVVRPIAFHGKHTDYETTNTNASDIGAFGLYNWNLESVISTYIRLKFWQQLYRVLNDISKILMRFKKLDGKTWGVWHIRGWWYCIIVVFTKCEWEVGFILSDKAIYSIVQFKPINDRLCILELKWYHVIMINCNAPKLDIYDDIKTAIYDELEMLYDSLPY